VLLAAIAKRLEQHLIAEAKAHSATLAALGERLEHRLEILASGQEQLLNLCSEATGVRGVSEATSGNQLGQVMESTQAAFHLGLKNCLQESSAPRSKTSAHLCADNTDDEGLLARVRRQVLRVVESGKFDFIMCVLIVLNVIFLGVQADEAARRPMQEESLGVTVIGGIFCWLFVGELVLRLVGFGRSFWNGEERHWNIFDFVIVSCTAAEEVISLIHLTEAPSNMAILRVMRILKFARIIRIVRVLKFFRELRIMMLSMVASARSLIWSVALLLMVMFGFAVSLCTAVAEGVSDGTIPLEQAAKQFGSLPKTLLLLLQVVTGGVDWCTVADDLAEVSNMLVALFIFYIIFVSFAVMNIMTGFFVECAMTSAEADLERVLKLQADDRDRTAKNLREVLTKEDEFKDRITWEELKLHLQKPKVKAYLQTLNLELMDLQCFFDLVASEKEEHPTVNIDEFVRCCLRLKGVAKNADVVVLRYQLEKLTHLLRQDCTPPQQYTSQQSRLA